MKRCSPLLICWCMCLVFPLGAVDSPKSEPEVAEKETPAPAPEPEVAGEKDVDDGEELVMDIETVDGKVYKNATVERVTPSCIDIGYLRESGSYAVIGLPLTQLTPELQNYFGYDPEQAKKFEEQLRTAGKRTLEETAESEAERMARVTSEIKALLSGDEVEIKPADLRFAIYARRRPVAVIPVERVRSGTVVAIIQDTSGLPQLPTLVLIDRLELAEGTGRWSGFLYPTGMHARYRDIERIPVFSDSLDDAQILLERYLDIYSEFAGAQKENAESAVPSETQNLPPDQAGVSGGEEKADGVSDSKGNSSFDAEDEHLYFLGSSYCPVVWWVNHRWNTWPRPRPMHPMRPPHSPRPPRPPKPNSEPKPTPGVKPPGVKIHPLPEADRMSVPRSDQQGRPNVDQPAKGKGNAVPPLSGTGKQPVRPSRNGSGINDSSRNRSNGRYQMERNGGFRRIIPLPAPTHPAVKPGVPISSKPSLPAGGRGSR